MCTGRKGYDVGTRSTRYGRSSLSANETTTCEEVSVVSLNLYVARSSSFDVTCSWRRLSLRHLQYSAVQEKLSSNPSDGVIFP